MVYVALDDQLSLYSFPAHPFNGQRYFVFKNTLKEKNILPKLSTISAREAKKEELLLFHTDSYIEFVKKKEWQGGFLDGGDTPVFGGIFKASRIVVGTTLNCIDKAVQEGRSVFTPIGGLHHAYKDRASGFCVFNDVCVGINYLRKKYKIKKILYFDIDAHHGDGVFYSFVSDPEVYIVDFHQQGIFPGTGYSSEKGKGDAYGTKLNIELPWRASDEDFFDQLNTVYKFLDDKHFEFIFFQAGCDCLEKDPLTSLCLSERVHQVVTKLLVELAKRKTEGRIVVLGGGGYLESNIKKGWVKVVEELILAE